MDKQLLIIIIFLVVTISLASLLVMGAVPKIFQTGEQINQTQTLINQTKHEDDARDIQRYLIVNETNNSMNNVEQHLVELINETREDEKQAEKRSATGAAERKQILN